MPLTGLILNVKKWNVLFTIKGTSLTLKLLYPKVIKIYDLRRKEPVPS
jgi:hypothetical protein